MVIIQERQNYLCDINVVIFVLNTPYLQGAL